MMSVLPRCDAPVVMNNLFQVFDPNKSGKVVPNDLLMAFSMSMNGTGKLNFLWNYAQHCHTFIIT